MKNIQNIDISLKEIVKNIKNNNYSIPKFQRDFVWLKPDITDLGDSIVRGYPISSLLTMSQNGTLQVGATDLVKDDFISDSTHKDNETSNYILDGQQRLTSIAKLFLSFDNKNEYYFDLLAILCENFPEDKIDEKSCIKDKFLKSKIEDSFCRAFQVSTSNDERPTRGNNRFISGKAVIRDKSGSIINKFLRCFSTHEFDDKKIDKYTDHLNAILNSVGSYSIPTTIISSDAELGVVIRVFEKVNSTGKKLTLFDLINAKSFETQNEDYKGGLSDYLKNKIMEKIEEEKHLKSGVNKFLKFDTNEPAFKKMDRIISIFAVSNLLENGSKPAILNSTMLEKDADFWFDTWTKNGHELLKIVAWMDNEGLIDIGQIEFLKYATAIFLANKKSFDSKTFKEEIKKYAIYLRLTGSSFNKSNLDVVERLYEISKKLSSNIGFDKYEYDSPIGKIDLKKDDILTATTGTAMFKAIKNLFYKDKIRGKFTVDIMGNQINSNETNMDNHHIYPKSKVRNFSSENKFNSIANIVFIDSTLNRLDIKDKKPSVYFAEIEKNPHAKFNCDDQNLIDLEQAKGMDSMQNAEIFIHQRAEKIANLINQHF